MEGEREDGRSERSRRSLESAVLASVIERHPETLSEADLLDEMTSIRRDSERVQRVGWAIEDLIAVGLLRRMGDGLSATPASLSRKQHYALTSKFDEN